MYLLFFKPYMQDQNRVKAISKENITTIEQTKNALKQYAEEGLEKLKAVKAFEGDNSVISACRITKEYLSHFGVTADFDISVAHIETKLVC